MNRRTLVIKTMVVAVLIAASIPARAEHNGRHGGEGRHSGDRGGWHGDIRHFERHDLHTWRGGSWRHERHEGRLGWWWIAAGAWYFYPEPVYPYPYPDPYIPPVVVEQPTPAPQPTAQFWYYCDASNGYYPYVSSCPSDWKLVPATPPGVPAQ